MQARIDYESKVHNDPIELLKSMKEHALNYEESRHEMAMIFNTLKEHVNCRQKEKESSLDFTKRFKVVREVLQSHLGGATILKKHVEKLPDCDETDKTKIDKQINAADEQLSTCVYLVNSDKNKHGSMTKGLHSQQALKNRQFSKTFVEGNNVLSKCQFDNSKELKNKNKNKDKREHNKEKENEEGTRPPLTFAQLEGKCCCCGKPGYELPQCEFKDKIPQEEWATNKTQLAQVNERKDKKESEKLEP